MNASAYERQQIVHKTIEFNAYGNQLRPIKSDELVESGHYIARKKKARCEHTIEIMTYRANRWVPCAFSSFGSENDALFWVDAINKNVDKEKMIIGLFSV
jgi:hypothetical protein